MTTVKSVPTTPAEKPTKVKILSGCTIGPGLVGAAGETWSLPRADAIILIGHGLAEYADEEDKPDDTIGVQFVEHTDRDPKAQKIGEHTKAPAHTPPRK